MVENGNSDALTTIYSQNITLLYRFRASSAHLQEDIVVYKQHMVLSLSIRILVACRYAASCVSTGPRTLTESDGTICCLYTTMSS